VFVGRQDELRALRDAYDDGSSGHSQIVLVEGEAGIGKTTLVERFLSELPGTRILRASGDESESHVPFVTEDSILAVATDGRTTDDAGLTLWELVALGAHEALNLDGGSAAVLVADGRRLNPPRDDEGQNLDRSSRSVTAIVIS
jgi:AAA+ ATPase superfamily predicted ATPase